MEQQEWRMGKVEDGKDRGKEWSGREGEREREKL